MIGWLPRVRMIGVVVLAASLAAVVVPASASAAQLFASPGGSGTACSQVSPCGLVTAVNNAGASDEVIVAGNLGSYGTPGSPIATQLNDAGSVNLHGAAGQPMPVIYSNSATAFVFNNGGTISDLDIEDVSTSGAALLVSNRADHLIARGGLEGCLPTPSSSIVDSICAGGSDGIGVSSGSSGTATMTLRND